MNPEADNKFLKLVIDISLEEGKEKGGKGKRRQSHRAFFLKSLSQTQQSDDPHHPPPILRIVNDNNQTVDGTVSLLSPAQSLLAIDPRTSAKSQPAAALPLVLPASTDQDWDKKVSLEQVILLIKLTY